MMEFKRDDLQTLKPYRVESVNAEIILDANESYTKYNTDIMEEVYEAIRGVDLTRYPRDNYEEICKTYGEYIGVEASKIIAGDGSDELINIILNTFLNSGDRLGTITPDFVMYEVFSKISSIEKVDIYNRQEDSVDIELLINRIKESRCKIFMFSNPNNPTGRIIKRDDIKKILSGVGCLVVVDEAYMEFADESVKDLVDEYNNLLVLRTCSKGLGLAAIRLGFCLCNEKLRYELLRVKPPYNISCITSTVGQVILSKKNTIDDNIQDVLRQRDRVFGFLSGISGLNCIKPYGNFVYIESNLSTIVYEGLLNRGIKIKVLSDMSMRITIGSESENTLLIDGIKEILTC